MAQVYNNFRVLDYDVPSGELTLGWYNDQLPIDGQFILRQGHRIPIEAEQNSWTRAQLLTFFLDQVNDVADIPQWAKDEAANTRGYFKFIPEINP